MALVKLLTLADAIIKDSRICHITNILDQSASVYVAVKWFTGRYNGND